MHSYTCLKILEAFIRYCTPRQAHSSLAHLILTHTNIVSMANEAWAKEILLGTTERVFFHTRPNTFLIGMRYSILITYV